MLILLTSGLTILVLAAVAQGQVNQTYWVQTIVYSATAISTSNTTVQSSLETSLMSAYTQAYTVQAYSSGTVGRKKRLATSTLTSALQLQLVSVTISSSNVANYYLTYYVLLSSNPVAASTVCSTLTQLNIQQMAITLGYLVVQQCSTYVSSPSSATDYQYWVLGACVGVLCGSVFLVSLILIAIYACANSGCLNDVKSNGESTFAPKNSAVYLDELEARLIEEEQAEEERRRMADELLNSMVRTTSSTVDSGKLRLTKMADSDSVAERVAGELRPQIASMLATQKSQLEKKLVSEVRNGVRKMERSQKRQLDEMSRSQRQFMESMASVNQAYRPEDDRRHAAELPENSVELQALDEVSSRKQTLVGAETVSSPYEQLVDDVSAHQHAEDVLVEAPQPLQDTQASEPDDLQPTLAADDAVAMATDTVSMATDAAKPRKRPRAEPVRFDSEFRVPPGNGSYMRHLEETGRRPGGPLVPRTDVIDVVSVGIAEERNADRLARTTLPSL